MKFSRNRNFKVPDSSGVQMSFGVAAVIILLGTCFGVYWLHHSSVSGHPQSTEVAGDAVLGAVFINGTAPIACTDDDFICATLDWWPPDNSFSISSTFLTLLQLFRSCRDSHGFLVEVPKSQLFSTQLMFLKNTLCRNSHGFLVEVPKTLLVSDPADVLNFLKTPPAGFEQHCSVECSQRAVVTFGLNALYGRTISSVGFVIGAWDSSNAESLIRYTVNYGYSIHGWELGNELSGNGVGARISAHQYASDIKNLHRIVQDVYRGFNSKPLVLALGGFFNAKWFEDFVDQAGKNVEVVTHHIYNLGLGITKKFLFISNGLDDPLHLVPNELSSSFHDPDLIWTQLRWQKPNHRSGPESNPDREIDLSPFDSQMKRIQFQRVSSAPFSGLESILKKSGTTAVAWVGEAGGAYNSGRNLVTNAFMFSLIPRLIADRH